MRPSTIRLRPSAFRLRPSALRLCPSAPKLRLSKSALPQHAQPAPQDAQTAAQHAQTAPQDAQTAPKQAQSKGLLILAHALPWRKAHLSIYLDSPPRMQSTGEVKAGPRSAPTVSLLAEGLDMRQFGACLGCYFACDNEEGTRQWHVD